MDEGLWRGNWLRGLQWPRAGEDSVREETAYAPSPALLSLIILPPFPRPWMRLFVPRLRPRQGRDLGFGIQGQRPSSGTHPSVLPASNIRLHFHGSPNLWRLLGGLGEKQAAHSLWCSAGVGVGGG